ncbi:zonular occludens toxin domain-containing protein [Aeromonas veronii]
MITLITGVPGSGKTLYCVDQILRPESEAGRALYVDNIPDLLIPHEPSPDPLDWPNWAPEGAHIVIDEVQRIWRPEAAGKTPHPSIAELEVHRHRGLDFTIMTQHPNLIHPNVRRLVGRHIHIRRTPLGVYAYEWSECKTSPDNAWKSAISKIRFSHPKRSFGLYKSASIHQKVKFRIPKALIVMCVGILLIPMLIWGVISVLSRPLATIDPSGNVAVASPVGSSQNSGSSLLPAAPSEGVGQVNLAAQPAPVKEVDIRETFIPRVQGEPNTAPAYDHLRNVVTMPVVAACIADADRCMCYTQQMTKVEMSDDQCRERVARGTFDPYREPEPTKTDTRTPVQQVES